MKRSILNSVYVVLGFFFCGLGAVGVILPVLPTTPFLLLAAFFFAKGSVKFHKWFIATRLYQNHLHEFVETRTMTLKTKVTILIPASLMMLLAIYFAPIRHVQYFLAGLMMFKYYYFACHIKTKRSVEDKREKEKKVVACMIEVYCKGHKHNTGNELCQDCQELLDYANARADRCPFMETKSFCNNCKIHCYKKDKKEQIKDVMRYSGPRMLLYHPIMAIHHVILDCREKRKLGELND